MGFTEGVIVLLPAEDDAERYVLDGEHAETSEDLHVTVQFLGEDVSGWSEDQRARALIVAEAAVAGLGGALAARVFAHATFNPDAHDDRDPCAVYLLGDNTKIGPVHEQISTTARALLGEQHPAQLLPFHPHMTAGYGLTAADLTETGEITFDRLGLWLAGDRVELPLGSTPVEVVRRGWASGYGRAGQPMTEHARLRCAAITRAAAEADLTEQQAHDDGAMTGLVVAVAAQHQQVHDTARAALTPLIGAFAAQVDLQQLRQAVQTGTPRESRREQAAWQLLTELNRSPVLPSWREQVVAAHTHAATAGAAAATHVISQGATPLQPAQAALPNPMSPDIWISAQMRSLGGDLTGPLADPDIDDDELLSTLTAGDGVLYALDLQLAQTWADGAVALYAAAGSGLLEWRSTGVNVCAPCLSKESGSPYPQGSAPGVEHGGCRCVILPWA